MSAYRVAGTDVQHQNYNATHGAVQKYKDFLSVVDASEKYFGCSEYDFDACRLAGTFFPYCDRVKDGGLAEFRAVMRAHLPVSARRRWRGYFLRRCTVLALARVKRGLKHG